MLLETPPHRLQDKQALAKVVTQPWGKGEGGVLSCPSLVGDHARSPFHPSAASPTPSTATSIAGLTPAAGSASPPSGNMGGSPSDDASDGKSRSPAFSGSSASIGGGNGGGAGGDNPEEVGYPTRCVRFNVGWDLSSLIVGILVRSSVPLPQSSLLPSSFVCPPHQAGLS